jgi:hypothetical protein
MNLKTKKLSLIVMFSLSAEFFSIQAYAVEKNSAADAGSEQVKNFGLSIDSGVSQQKYSETSSTLKHITLQPYYSWGGAWVSLSVPWYSVDGEYIIQASHPVAVQRGCEIILALTPVQQQVRVKTGRLTQERINACKNVVSSSTIRAQGSGVGDATLSASYWYPLGDDGVWSLTSSLQYKWDNGNVENGLGSDTKDLDIGFTLARDLNKWHNNVSVGRTTVSGSQNNVYQSFSYGSIDTSFDVATWLNVGSRYNYEQTSIVGGDAIKTLSFFSTAKASEQLSFTLSLAEYIDVSNYPDSEVSFSMSYFF